jgi:hypothetical protein
MLSFFLLGSLFMGFVLAVGNGLAFSAFVSTRVDERCPRRSSPPSSAARKWAPHAASYQIGRPNQRFFLSFHFFSKSEQKFKIQINLKLEQKFQVWTKSNSKKCKIWTNSKSKQKKKYKQIRIWTNSKFEQFRNLKNQNPKKNSKSEQKFKIQTILKYEKN